MPLDLVLVRHGESEGNKARKIREKGGEDPFTPEFLDRHSSEFRLTDKGRQQAIVTGEWIRQHMGDVFDVYETSEYVRAMETAGLMQLPGARWQRDLDLRERDHGFADLMHPDERESEYGKELIKFKKNSLINPAPGGGESIANMRQRSWRIFCRLRRKHSKGRAILVCHGDFMWGCRIDLEHITMDQFFKIRASKNPFDRIHNCQVLHYTRLNPHNGMVSDYYTWMRSVCPSAPHLSSNDWTPIVRHKFSNEELLTEVNNHKRYIG